MNFIFILTTLNFAQASFLFGSSKKPDFGSIDWQNSTDTTNKVGALFEDGKMTTSNTLTKRKSSGFFNRNSSSKSSPDAQRLSNGSLSSRGSSLSSPTASMSSRSSRGSTESDMVERTASGSEAMPDLSHLIDFNGISAIKWEDISEEPSLPDNFESLLQEYFRNGAYRRNTGFQTNVRKTLAFVKDTFPLNPFIINLAIKLVQRYEDKAPNALKLFLESKFEFMKNFTWSQENFVRMIKKKLGNSAKYNELFNDPRFIGHVQTLFLDILCDEKNELYKIKEKIDDMLYFFMIIFRQPYSEEDFYSRVAYLVHVLYEITSEKFGESQINVERIESEFVSRFDSFKNKIEQVFDNDQ